MATATTSTPGVSAACCDPGTPLEYTPVGTEGTVHELPCYTVGSGATAVVFVTDVFGWQYVNSRHLADYIANNGPFTVYTPDVLGTPISIAAAETLGKAAVIPWMAFHSATSTIPPIRKFTSALRGQHQRVLAIGICYGASHVCDMLVDGTIDAGSITHSAETSDKYPKEISRPVQFNCAESDDFFPDKTRDEWEKGLKERGVDATFIVYPGTEHGFCTRAKGGAWNKTTEKGADENTAEQQKKCHQNIVAFLNKHASQ